MRRAQLALDGERRQGRRLSPAAHARPERDLDEDVTRQLLGAARQKPREYYEAWGHVAFCQAQNRQADAARRSLKSILALSSQVMASQHPEIKKKYDDLLRQLGG